MSEPDIQQAYRDLGEALNEWHEWLDIYESENAHPLVREKLIENGRLACKAANAVILEIGKVERGI